MKANQTATQVVQGCDDQEFDVELRQRVTVRVRAANQADAAKAAVRLLQTLRGDYVAGFVCAVTNYPIVHGVYSVPPVCPTCGDDGDEEMGECPTCGRMKRALAEAVRS